MEDQPCRGSSPANTKQAIFILGMHRSGTSALTRVLNLCGAFLPDKLMPPKQNNNETGFWEPADLVHFNEEVLRSANSAWDDYTDFPERWFGSEAAAKLHAKALKLVTSNFQDHPLFVIKDPRVCRLVPFWTHVVHEYGAEPLFILPIRNPLEVAASLEKRDGFLVSKSVLLWLQHFLAAERHTRNQKRAFVTYEQLLNDWRGTIHKVERELEVCFGEVSTEAEAAIAQFLRPDLRHHHSDFADILQNPFVPSWVAKTYDWAIRASNNIHSVSYEELDKMYDAFQEANRAFSPLLEHQQKDHQDSLLILNQELASYKQEVSNYSNHLQVLNEQVTEFSKELSERVQQVEHLSTKLLDSKQKVSTLSHELSTSQEQIETLSDEVKELNRQMEVLQNFILLEKASGFLSWRSWIRNLGFHFFRRRIMLIFRILTLRSHAEIQALKNTIKVETSGLFDASYYLRKNIDVLLGGADPILHYLHHGAFEDRDPNPHFSSQYYLEQYPDVAKARVNPLLHYVLSGAAEGRRPTPNVESLHALHQIIEAKKNRGLVKQIKQLNKLSRRVFSWIEGKPLSDNPRYQVWLDKNYRGKRELQALIGKAASFVKQPLISIIMPVYNPKPEFLKAAIQSVIGQTYQNWELCIADDASTDSRIKSLLQGYSKTDPRIKVVFREQNGHISEASNSALAIATGEYVALLDHDDVLTGDALYEVVDLINHHPEADLIYSDEDKIDDKNYLRDPYFKPDWSPDTLLSKMYVCHMGVYRKKIVDEVGGFRPGYEGAQDYDLVLRFTEKTSNIFHISNVLYHWRIHAGSTSSSIDTKDYALIAGQKALEDAIARRQEPGKVITTPNNHYLIRYDIKTCDRVSIIIPTRDLGAVLDRCLISIFTKTTYPNFEVVLVDNGTTEEEALNVFQKWKTKEPERFQVFTNDIPFNYSKLNNFGVEKATGQYLLFLNNDTEVIHSDWLEAMVEQAQRPSIGAVGPLLLYPDDTVQHAGVIAGIGGVAGHSHKYHPGDSPGYFDQIQTINNYSALTAACLMCRRSVFEEVGGFEEALKVAFNDIDFCFKLIEKGYQNVYLPHVVLYHYESKSRGYEDTPEKRARFEGEADYMKERWKDLIERDPYYNKNLSLQSGGYAIAVE
ncbi:glycosyltransferase [Leptolyngbya sp. AN02str]|uniref:glycosyltransferase n=1 Tax=Leptolyngbya sp. AN02str TaxID=3423363 RepID=UPI003D310F3D